MVKFHFTITEKKQRQLRLQRTCFSNREKKEKTAQQIIVRPELSPISLETRPRRAERWGKSYLAREVLKRAADKFPRREQDIGVAGERERRRASRQAGRQSTTVLLSCQRLQPRAMPPLSLLPPSPPPSVLPPAHSLSLSPSVFIPSGGREAWAVDNVIYTGRVINVLGDRRFKKTIGNRRQRRATVRPPVSWPPLR